MEQKFPLFIVTGASGVGKTTVMQELRVLLPDFVVFSTDIDNFGTTASKLDYQDRYNLLLHFANFVFCQIQKRNDYLRHVYALGCPKNVILTMISVNSALLTYIAIARLVIIVFVTERIKRCGRMKCSNLMNNLLNGFSTMRKLHTIPRCQQSIRRPPHHSK